LLGQANATNQSVAAIDFPSKNASTATRLHWFVRRSTMTIDEAIERLGQLRVEYGGDMPFCIEKESIQSGKVNLFEPVKIEVYNVVEVPLGEKTHWVCLMAGNDKQVAVAW
jgi:hypothetical protein